MPSSTANVRAMHRLQLTITNTVILIFFNLLRKDRIKLKTSTVLPCGQAQAFRTNSLSLSAALKI